MRLCRIFILTALSFVFSSSLYAQYKSKYPDIPIVDVHVHARAVSDVSSLQILS